MSDKPEKTYLPRPLVAQRYNITDRSIARWELDPELAFPKPMIVNGRKFFALDELETWERSRAASSNQKAA